MKDKLYGHYNGDFGQSPEIIALENMRKRIDNLYTWTPINEINETDDGNITTAIATAECNIGFKSGDYYIDRNVEVKAALFFADGARLHIPDDVTITCKSSVTGGRCPIFIGGNVKLNDNTIVFPEWFGAVALNDGDDLIDSSVGFNKAISSISQKGGCVSLVSGNFKVIGDGEKYGIKDNCYYVSNPVIVSHSHIHIGCGNGKAVIFSNGNTVFSSNGSFAENVDIHDIMIYNNGSASQCTPMLIIENFARSSVRRLRIVKAQRSINVWQTTNLLCEDIEISPFITDDYVCETIGIEVNSTPHPVRDISPNASARFSRCLFNFVGTKYPERCYAIICDGADQRDLFFDNCEVALGNGLWFVNGANYAFDVHIHHWIHDQVSDFSIKIEGSKQGLFNINGGYISGGANATAGIIAFGGGSTVAVNNVEFQGDTAVTAFRAILVENARSLSSVGCSFLNCYNCVYVVDTSASIMNNAIITDQNRFTSSNKTMGDAITIVSGGATIIGNIFRHFQQNFQHPYAIKTECKASVIGNVYNGLDVLLHPDCFNSGNY